VKTSHHDSGELQALLDLDGTEIELMDGQFFTKFEVHKVEPSPAVPHGIKYSLTLHDKMGKRVLGFDNAHPIKIKKGRFVERPTEADHWHYGPGEAVKKYRFQGPGKLLVDFWAEVEKFTGIEE
jgi:hypothetical protein